MRELSAKTTRSTILPGAAQVRDGAVVMTCLKRALKVANAAQQQLAMSAKRTGLSEPVRLYVDILNQYLFFFDQGVPNITVSVLQVWSDFGWCPKKLRRRTENLNPT